MKYAVILSLALGAFAVPQNAATVTSAPAAPLASGLTPAVSCVLQCDPKDVNCQAACQGIARPNASQAIDTNKCAAKCDQGDGSASAAKQFSDCVQGCIASLFPSSQTAFAPGNIAAASASSVSAGASVTGSSSLSPTASIASRISAAASSATGSAAIAESTGAADMNTASFAGAGLAGLLAIFVL